MNNLTLVIANKNYSSWSLRAWLLMTQFKVNFQEVRIPLDTPDTPALMDTHSPNRRVPVLKIGKLSVWDSLAICETVNERFLQGAGWPSNPDLRAIGRSACAEMHSAFGALRQTMPMNCRRVVSGFTPDTATQADIERMLALLTACLTQSDGPFLLGRFSIADAFFAPVAIRLRGYRIETPELVTAWIDQLFDLPALQAWLDDAGNETETIDAEEVPDRG
ncbi:glutathione S-transferase family protein [Saccharospirillum impatiens]|uniref:glutathione S-transferase family protein n=1 Tax=Saccharospirillum impatiens TaxID=169438 RepID=UPI0003FC405E|nr:glutathione S-transferase family protein [Saccharospirillum impatiens]